MRGCWSSPVRSRRCWPTRPSRESALDARRLALYLAFGYLPTPETAFRGITMLPPGHVLRAAGGQVGIELYTHLPRPWEEGRSAVSDAEQKSRLRHVLDEAVKRTLISDVPLGAFLSGGLDSSLVVALMRRHSNAAVKTFSIGFTGDASFDETPYAETRGGIPGDGSHGVHGRAAGARAAAQAGLAPRSTVRRQQRHPDLSGQQADARARHGGADRRWR
ncbi:MAG: hypothetical protein IPK19_19410 [Chloroflexi bacterium]|nr:hypothetical protein [Chloroflexota bacterium]